jgi:hypothetical protein
VSVLSEAEDGLTGHVGPVPVWGIAVGISAVGIGAYYLYKRKATLNASVANVNTGAATADALPVQAGGLAGGTAATGIVDPSYSTSGYNTANSSPSDTAATGYGSNAAWLAAAGTATAAEKNASFFDVSNALQQYTAGAVISTQQKGYVDTAIALKGYPPEGVQAISTVMDPAAPAAAPTVQAPAQTGGGTVVQPKTPILGYAVNQQGINYAVTSWRPFNGTVVSGTTARANGVKWKISNGGVRIAGPGVSYIKVPMPGADPIYSVVDGERYHLSPSQYAWIGKPHYETVKK